MKKQLTLALICVAILTSCQQPVLQQECPPAPIAEQFMSIMVLKGDNSVTYKEGSYEGILNDVVLESIRKFKKDSFDFYEPLGDPMDEPLHLTKAEVERKLVYVDSLYFEDPEPPFKLSLQVVRDSMNPELFHSLRVFEKWFVDRNFRLTREVVDYITTFEQLDRQTGEVRGLEPYFYVRSSKQIGKPKKLASVRYKQGIDTEWPKELRGHWFRENLEHSARRKFLHPLMTKAESGEIPVYESPGDEKPLSVDQLRAKLLMVDTLFRENPAPPYDMEMFVVEASMNNPYEVTAIEFVQDLYVYENLALEIDVKWYAPVIALRDQATGAIRGEETLYWIKNN